MAVLDKIFYGQNTIEDKILFWMSDEWVSTTDIHTALNRNEKAIDLHAALLILVRKKKLVEMKEVMRTGGAPKTLFRLAR